MFFSREAPAARGSKTGIARTGGKGGRVGIGWTIHLAAQSGGSPKLIGSADWCGGGAVPHRASVDAVIPQGAGPTFGKAIGRGGIHGWTKFSRDEDTGG
jgi:hypothetical protein